MRTSRLVGAVLCLCILGFPAANAAIRYVKADARGTSTGTSWANAYTSLQSALGAANSGDEIRVAAGTYKPTAGVDRTISFVMKNGVALYGGFAGNETSRNRDFAKHRSILSGEIGASTTTMDNTYHVVIGANGRLDGFTITAGYADRENDLYGAGMCNIRVIPTVANCFFANNTVAATDYDQDYWWGADSVGGAVYNAFAAPYFVNCIFEQNSVTGSHYCTMGKGGAIYADTSSTLHLTNCIFYKNSATGGSGQTGASPYLPVTDGMGCGGAVYAKCMVVLTNCTFYKNTVTGGWIDEQDYHGTIIPGHYAGAFGAGLYVYWDYRPTRPLCRVINCVFKGSGIYIDNAKVAYSNCDIEGSGGSGDSWNRNLGWDWKGNIDADPKFVNGSAAIGADGIWCTADDGLRLQAGSPCIDAGTLIGASSRDIAGQLHFYRADMGAYENASRNAAGVWAIYR